MKIVETYSTKKYSTTVGRNQTKKDIYKMYNDLDIISNLKKMNFNCIGNV